jgi:uncharacterized protein
MKDDLMKLLEAQEVDLKIDALMKSQVDYPEQIEFLNKEIEDLRKELDDLRQALTQAKISQQELETEIQAEREILSGKEKRLLETKTNKEYNAVQSEIEQARARINSLETELIEVMGRIENLEPRIEETQKKLEEVASLNTSQIKELKSRLDSVDTDKEKLEKERARILANVNKRLLAVYTRLRKGRKGIAIASVNKAKFSCRGCFKHLPPQKVMEIRRGATLINCENCGRILIWDERETD